MDEKEWMEKYVQDNTWGWQELVSCGHAPLEKLDDGPLRTAIEGFLNGESDAQRILDGYGYEAG